jgi:hypothetical protein
VHQAQHEIEVVNHEIENNCNIGPARPEWRKSMAFHENRLVEVRLARTQRSIEALDVTDLNERTRFFGGFQHAVGRSQVRRNRFLDEDVYATRESRARYPFMCCGWNGDDAGLNLLEEFVLRVDRGDAELCRHLCPARGAGIVHTYQLDSRHVAQDTRVMEAQAANANHTDFE